MVALFTVLWFLGAPAAEQFVLKVITGEGLASQSTVSKLEQRVERVADDQQDLSKLIERQGAQIDSIESMAAEQRSISTQILLELRRK